MFNIQSGDELVNYIKDFTGSTNTTEIKNCIFLAEMTMRNIELPALRSDPFDPQFIGVVDSTGGIEIPGDMNKPILFFKQGVQYITTATCTGTIGTNTLTLVTSPLQNVIVGMLVIGAGIPPNTEVQTVSGLLPGSTITLTNNLTSNVNGLITFQTSPPASQSSQTGPWIVYDRIGDRDIITQGMIAQLYLQPVNVPAVIRGKFSEVAQRYKFLPYVAEGDLINLYYYRAWPLLFSPINDILVSTTGSINPISGAGPWTIAITGMTSTASISVGNFITCTPGTGSLGVGFTSAEVTQILSGTSIEVVVTGGSSPNGGTVSDISLTDLQAESNAVLATWPEGYVYGTLREYYIKRHNDADASIYAQKFDNAWNTVNDQNNLGKWSGGHTRLTSVWQPRQYRQYNIK